MSKRLEEKQEVTRGTLAVAGLWVLVAYGIIPIAVLVLEQRLGISAETIKTLPTHLPGARRGGNDAIRERFS